MFNKDLRFTETTIFLNKLSALLERLNLQYRDGTFQTQEDVVEEFNKALKEFYERAHTPFLRLRPARKGTSPSYLDYNDSFKELSWDLDVVFKEIATLEKTILKNFNHTLSERDKLNKLVKRVSSKVGDYVLYSEDPIGNTIYFKDSFNDVSRMDFGSELLSQKQCEINVAEGIVTLPVIRSDTPTSKAMKVQINESSGPDGSVGNYQEIGAAPHDDIRDILDSNPDTWFEYERVQRTKAEDTRALVLDLTFYFEEPQVINSIRINPNNFGTQTPVSIEQIDTSYNGNVWISIKDDIPISGFLQEDEENVFTLAPSTSKYTGQGLYTFTPRKIKYIHLILKQDTPYKIDTSAGERWRYAIGIRDIEAKAIPYEANGDIISASYDSPVEIKKVSLLASENPAEVSELADITHQISADDGATWHDIQPQDRHGVDVPEILNFNTSDVGAIATASPVFSLRHRMLLSRDAGKFEEGSSTLSTIVEGGSDILGLPSNSPTILGLTRPPVIGTMRLMNPLWGARALDGLKIVENIGGRQETRRPVIRAVGTSTGQANQEFKEVLSQEIGEGLVDIWSANNEVVVWIDNDPTWIRVGEFTAGNNDKEYKITNDGSIIFGDRDLVASSGAGRIPAGGALIGFTLKEERLQLSASSPYTCDLVLSTDGDKKNVKIYRIDKKVQIPNADNPESFALRPGARVIRLPHKLLLEGTYPSSESTLTFSGTGASATFATYKEFQDGNSEFAGTGGEYSVDWEQGIIYNEDGVPADADGWTIGYWYVPRTELAEKDWDFIVDADRKYNRISIKDTGYADTDVETVALTGSVRMIQLVDEDSSAVKGVIPGSIEFDGTPFTSGVTPHEVPFQDGETEFKRQDTQISIKGYYSVDYQNGILYAAAGDPTAGSPGNVSFKYTNFVACYNISKFISSDAYTVDTAAQTVSISEREALKLWGDRDASVANKQLVKAIYDYVQATRESIEELEPYFTPIVRDIVVKILPGE
jgi:hypothetical protein